MILKKSNWIAADFSESKLPLTIGKHKTIIARKRANLVLVPKERSADYCNQLRRISLADIIMRIL